MSAIVFAKENAGKRYIIPAAFLPDTIVDQMYPNFNYYGQLVGYCNEDDSKVIVELEESSFRKDCWPLYDGVVLTIHRDDMYDSNHPMVLAINYKQLKELKRPSWESYGLDSKKEEVKPEKIVPAYPSTCKKCHEPARKYGKLVVCSNRACDTRAGLLTHLGVKYTKMNVIRCHWHKNGKVCKKRAVSARKRSSLDTIYHLTCEEGHSFNISVHDLKIDDVVLASLEGGQDKIWDGKKWQTY